VGRRRPLYAGASSKLLLSCAPPAVLEQVLASERPRFTTATPVSKTALVQELRKVREQGYALSMGERAADTAAIAVPVLDAGGNVVAALSISTPATRMTEAQAGTFLRALQQQAREASRHLGWVQPATAPTP
jgi:DNA-binding IclR family transcriptional regulator